jgi:hypothetical protein
MRSLRLLLVLAAAAALPGCVVADVGPPYGYYAPPPAVVYRPAPVYRPYYPPPYRPYHHGPPGHWRRW